MLDPEQRDDLVKKLLAALPNSLQNLEKDIQQQFKEILQFAFAKTNLVTREEFDVQTRVLLRTREKVESLQQRVAELHAMK